MSARPRLIACGIFQREFLALPPALRGRFAPAFVDSMLHMAPEKLDGILAAAVSGLSGDAVLAFGDCCPHMLDYCSRGRVPRTRGANCCEIYLGPERYRELVKAGAFFLMPEWVPRWERILRNELGLGTEELAREFMGQSMRLAVYVDTGVMELPRAELDAFSRYTGLPVSVETAGLDRFRRALEDAVASLDSTEAPESPNAMEADPCR